MRIMTLHDKKDHSELFQVINSKISILFSDMDRNGGELFSHMS